MDAQRKVKEAKSSNKVNAEVLRKTREKPLTWFRCLLKGPESVKNSYWSPTLAYFFLKKIGNLSTPLIQLSIDEMESIGNSNTP